MIAPSPLNLFTVDPRFLVRTGATIEMGCLRYYKEFSLLHSKIHEFAVPESLPLIKFVFQAGRTAFTQKLKCRGGDQLPGVGRDLRMRSEKSFAFPAACAASLMRERRRSSSNGRLVSKA